MGRDIENGNWIEARTSPRLHPYLRLARIDRPIGIWLLLFPCWWGVILAGTISPEPQREILLMGLFALGAVVMRGAGCTLNDIIDRDLDARVERTAVRPIPAGEVSLRQALIFLALQLLLGLGVLLAFNPFTVLLGIAALPLVIAYPFMKRLTYWPQAFLGLTFNWGALMGWAALTGGLSAAALALYAAGIAWTLGYDTIYAHQDREDDALAGIKSTALKFGPATHIWLAGFFGAAIFFLALAGRLAGLVENGINWPFYAGLALTAGHFCYQIAQLKIDDAGNCLALFKSNILVGWIVLATFLIGRLAQ
ncbi:MAG: 4-hydroxybenzoate octaprenyltransferase [Rhodospirillaceae bacterium]|nr:4-hydroxybenzoate octaprenyltransferase [Rhodospirillaceae bacterium]MBT5374414.1 4-hydroxybenzoate octaprenyltransferase [Rhodospirillaceae bacterium]MBT5751899.1 4-hydroxybenzoate octaprenyltransferase [Rhodospirillaceae bacterium]